MSLAHVKSNEGITAEVPGIARVYNTAKALLDSITAADTMRKHKLSAVTAGKRQYLNEMAHNALLVSSAVVSFAAEKKDDELKKAMTYSPSDLFHAPEKNLGAILSAIMETAKPLSSALKDFGVTEELFTVFSKQVETYLERTTHPVNSRTEHKTAGQQIDQWLNQLKDILDNQLDGLMIQFKFSQPEFYKQYFNKRRINNPARRKTRLEGLVTENKSQAPLGDVQLVFSDPELNSVTNADGSFSLGMKPEKGVEVSFVKEGYATAKIKVDMKRGQALYQEVVLEKLA